MGPSAYHAKLAKDHVVEDRGGVKVVFAGGSVFHLYVDGADGRIAVRGAKAAWERSEAERAKLYSEYVPIPYEAPSEQPASTPAETEGVPSGEGQTAPADNATDSSDEGANEAQPEADPAIPPGEADGEGDGGDDDEGSEDAEATRDEHVHVITLHGGEFPVVMVSVDAVEAALGTLQGRLAGFIGDPRYRRLQDRVRATDGCCAPIFFVEGSDEEAPSFLAGLETLGAAKHLGMTEIAVVMLPPETAAESQGPIASLFNAANAAQSDSDDEMAYRAYN